MNYFSQAIAWIADPANASGPNGVWARSWEHLWYTILAVVLASVIAIPLGYLVGHTGRGRGLVVASSEQPGRCPRWAWSPWWAWCWASA